MEALQITWNLLTLFSIFAVPQLLGVLIYFRIRGFSRLLAHVVGFLLATTSYVYLAGLFLIYLPAKAHPEERCGLPLLGALYLVFLTTFVTIFASIIVQVILKRAVNSR